MILLIFEKEIYHQPAAVVVGFPWVSRARGGMGGGAAAAVNE
jgi:hypothetical protein